MTWADYAILAILGVSTLLSVFRGFVREALALLGWILAFWVAITFGDSVATLLTPYISAPSLRLAAAFVAVFVGVLLLTALAVYLIGLLVESTGVSATDRILGIAFGLARGVLIVGVLVLVAGLTAMPREAWWQRSALIPHFERVAVALRGVLPPEIAEHLIYRPVGAPVSPPREPVDPRRAPDG